MSSSAQVVAAKGKKRGAPDGTLGGSPVPVLRRQNAGYMSVFAGSDEEGSEKRRKVAAGAPIVVADEEEEEEEKKVCAAVVVGEEGTRHWRYDKHVEMINPKTKSRYPLRGTRFTQLKFHGNSEVGDLVFMRRDGTTTTAVGGPEAAVCFNPIGALGTKRTGDPVATYVVTLSQENIDGVPTASGLNEELLRWLDFKKSATVASVQNHIDSNSVLWDKMCQSFPGACVIKDALQALKYLDSVDGVSVAIHKMLIDRPEYSNYTAKRETSGKTQKAPLKKVGGGMSASVSQVVAQGRQVKPLPIVRENSDGTYSQGTELYGTPMLRKQQYGGVLANDSVESDKQLQARLATMTADDTIIEIGTPVRVSASLRLTVTKHGKMNNGTRKPMLIVKNDAKYVYFPQTQEIPMFWVQEV